MRTLGFLLIVILFVISVWFATNDESPAEPPPPAVHVVDPRGDVQWSPPTSSLPTTTTTPRARTAPSERRLVVADNHGQIAAEIRAGFARFGAAVAEEAVKVAGCESTGDDSGALLNPTAVNGSHVGLFQISRQYHDERVRRLGFTWDDLLQVGPNVAVAADIYAESGWGPWECRWVAA